MSALSTFFPPRRADGRGEKKRNFSFRTSEEMGAVVDELVASGYSVTDVMNQALIFFSDAMREMGPYAPLYQHEAQLRGCSIGCAAGQLSAEKIQDKYPDFAATLKGNKRK